MGEGSPRCWRLGTRLLAVIMDDITTLRVEAVVNPANSRMIMGGGVAGALKRVGGAGIEEEALEKAPVPVGSAIITGAGKLPSRYVIHAPTMEEPAMRIALYKAFRASYAALKLASDAGFSSVAIPAMGAGVGGLSVRESAKAIALAASLIEGRWPEYILLVSRSKEPYLQMVEGVSEALGSEGEECPADLNRFL